MSFLCALPLIASLLGCVPAAPLAVGYVEGEFVRLAPIELATVQAVLVRRGDRVEAGQPLAEMESGDAAIAVAQAEAALAQARAQLADLRLGKRPEEIAVLEAMVRSASRHFACLTACSAWLTCVSAALIASARAGSLATARLASA